MLNVLTCFLFGTECSWRQQNLFWTTVNSHLGGGIAICATPQSGRYDF